MEGRYFGTDGFRGRAGETITSEQAFKVGRFLGWYFSDRCRRAKIVIGKDTRLSSYTLEYALAAGVTASGGDAYIMHVTTTPSVSYVTRSEGFDCGVMISASHNAYADNGIKLLNGRGEKLERGVLGLIEEYIDGKLSPSPPFATGENMGRTVDFVAGRNRYVGHLISISASSYKGVKVGLDCANGASYKIAKSVFDALGATVFAVGNEPNGTNVNEGCGSTKPQALSALVTANGLDVGFAFDGDADRCICVDSRGNIVDGDGVMYAAARYLKGRGELPGSRIVATVMSNGGLSESLQMDGIEVVQCDVGDSCVYDKMNECGAVLGGEQSGHIIFGKLERTGDGIVTALTVTEIMLDKGLPLSELVSGFTKKPQLTVNVRVRDKISVLRGRAVREAVEEVRGALRCRGRLLLRPSGTEDVVRITVESDRAEECESLCRRLESVILKEDVG